MHQLFCFIFQPQEWLRAEDVQHHIAATLPQQPGVFVIYILVIYESPACTFQHPFGLKVKAQGSPDNKRFMSKSQFSDSVGVNPLSSRGFSIRVRPSATYHVASLCNSHLCMINAPNVIGTRMRIPRTLCKYRRRLPAVQVLLCTATMPEAVTEAAARWLTRPASCRIEGAGEVSGTAISCTVTQVWPPSPCVCHKHGRGCICWLAR